MKTPKVQRYIEKRLREIEVQIRSRPWVPADYAQAKLELERVRDTMVRAGEWVEAEQQGTRTT